MDRTEQENDGVDVTTGLAGGGDGLLCTGSIRVFRMACQACPQGCPPGLGGGLVGDAGGGTGLPGAAGRTGLGSASSRLPNDQGETGWRANSANISLSSWDVGDDGPKMRAAGSQEGNEKKQVSGSCLFVNLLAPPFPGRVRTPGVGGVLQMPVRRDMWAPGWVSQCYMGCFKAHRDLHLGVGALAD